MAKMKLKPCPFCGAELKDEFPTVSNYDKGKWEVQHYCATDPTARLEVTISAYGYTKTQAVARWNARAKRRRADL